MGPIRRIIVAVDGSETSRSLMDYAFAYAAQFKDVQLDFLHVVEPVRLADALKGHGAEKRLQSPFPGSFETCVKEALRSSGRKISRVSMVTRSGVPHLVIGEYAEETSAEMVMIGSCGMGDREKVTLESLPSRLLLSSPCSVYVHRPPKGAIESRPAGKKEESPV